jgi:hypothetical protein
MNDSDQLLTKNSYITFDANSLRDLIVNRLNNSKVFTDQNYQGSNISAFLDVISYSFSTLMYYLNKTSSETSFSDAQIYENINRLVKILNYNPIGRLGQTLPFTLTVDSTISTGNYIIPRFSYINVGGTSYSFNTDIKFYKPTNGTDYITEISNNYLLYQGLFQEYDTYNAIGITNETIYLSLLENEYVDHFNIYVFVKQKNSNYWQEWQRVPETFLYSANDRIFQVRFNENKRYEIKFGDDVNGKGLSENDQVAIYYLKIDKDSASLGVNALQNSKIVNFKSLRFDEIFSNLNVNNLGTVIPDTSLRYLFLDNEYPSTFFTEEESVEMIKKNAPKTFRSQYRLVTSLDYESYVKTNFSNLITDVKILNNENYMREHIKYLYDIGLNSPQKDDSILLNQIKFADSCNFNNIYVYLVPKSKDQNYLAPAQKEYIINGLNPNKTLTSEIVPMDPVYMYIDFYISNLNTDPSPKDLDQSYLLITKKENSRRSNSSILSDIEKIINDTFNRKVNTLGQIIDIYQLSTSIFNVDGVKNVQTYRADTNSYVEGVSLLIWNYYYPIADSNVYTQNLQLDSFKYPIFNNIKNVTSKIIIDEPSGNIKLAEF